MQIRAGYAIAPSAARTYHSHLNPVREACGLLQSSVLAADLATVRRVSSIVPTEHIAWLVGCLASVALVGSSELVWRSRSLIACHSVGLVIESGSLASSTKDAQAQA